MAVTKICPKCKSNNISQLRGGFLSVMGMSEDYVCNDCGFSSPIFPDVEISDEEDLKHMRETLADLKEEEHFKAKTTRRPSLLQKAAAWYMIIGAIVLIVLFIFLALV